MVLRPLQILPVAILAFLISGCNTVDDDRIPAMPVNIDLSLPSQWSVYGVDAYGESRLFIKALGQPRDFNYTARTSTGYGGVLLVNGFNPYTIEAGVPMAYDLSCPVECKPDIRVAMQPDGAVPLAVCPVCGSGYDVVEKGGAPVSGQALSEKLGLRRYECYQSQYGGYVILDR